MSSECSLLYIESVRNFRLFPDVVFDVVTTAALQLFLGFLSRPSNTNWLNSLIFYWSLSVVYFQFYCVQ